MKVSSPVGDFPFTPTAIRVEGRSVVVDGAMGAWPARVSVDPADVPAVIRLLPAPLLAGLVTLAIVVLIRLVRPRNA